MKPLSNPLATSFVVKFKAASISKRPYLMHPLLTNYAPPQFEHIFVDELQHAPSNDVRVFDGVALHLEEEIFTMRPFTGLALLERG
jgi:hypothetical protein